MTTLQEFCTQKLAEGFVLNRDAWRKIMRKLAIERKYEKRLGRELESNGYIESRFYKHTELKLKIMLLEDFRKAMQSKLVKRRVQMVTTTRANVRPVQVSYWGGDEAATKALTGAFPQLPNTWKLRLCREIDPDIVHTLYAVYPTCRFDDDGEVVWKYCKDFLGIVTTKELLRARLEKADPPKFAGIIRAGTQQDGIKDFSVVERQENES